MLSALRNRRLLRVQAAYFLYNLVEWASWIAILVWAYDAGGVRAASALAVVQLVPSALLASPAANWLDRLPRARALALGYSLQAVTLGAIGLALAFDAPSVLVVVAAALAAVAMTLTRPVHHALLPEISDTTAELTAGNSTSGWAEAAGVFLGPLVCGGLMNQDPNMLWTIIRETHLTAIHGVGLGPLEIVQMKNKRSEERRVGKEC